MNTHELAAYNVIVLDLETRQAAQDCHICLMPQHEPHQACPYAPMGWSNLRRLGLSIGGYYSYTDQRVHWFDTTSLSQTVETLVAGKAYVVTYNGKQFDVPLMAALYAEDTHHPLVAHAVLPRWQEIEGYDILDAIRQADPENKYTRGLNGLGAVAQANHLGGKHIETGGVLAPVLWRDGRHADVINYCQQDIYLTKALFEMILRGSAIHRNNGSSLQLHVPRFHTQEAL